MISGTVNARLEAVIRLRVRAPAGAEVDFDAIIDTGFTSSLTLPSTAVTALGLVRQSGGSAALGDGSVRSFDVNAAEVEWGGNWRSALVSALGDEVLVGMRLLAGMSFESRSCRVAGRDRLSPLKNRPA
jgi:clan AA aspartic protease